MTLTETITWIPVEERLPEVGQSLVKASWGPYIHVCVYVSGDWVDTRGRSVMSVTHWAEMPKGPL